MPDICDIVGMNGMAGANARVGKAAGKARNEWVTVAQRAARVIRSWIRALTVLCEMLQQ